MDTMKKILTTMLLFMFTVTIWAYDAYVNGIYYEFVKDMAWVTCGNRQYAGNIKIPETVTYNGATYKVTKISQQAFRYCEKLNTVTISNSVVDIESEAFYECTGLSTVTLGKSLTNIGGSAFEGCTRLQTIAIPNSVKSIGGNAFNGCKGLIAVKINDLLAWCSISFNSNPLTYAHHLYLNGKEIRHLEITDTITSIKEGTFEGCLGLVSVKFSDSVVSIGDNAFSGCEGLTSLTLPSSITSIGNRAFSGCKGLTSLTLPISITSIGDCAFSGCTNLKTITLPYFLKDIGGFAFSGCKNINTVTCYAKDVPKLSPFYDAFEKCYLEYATLKVLASTINLYKKADIWSSFGTITNAEIVPEEIRNIEIKDSLAEVECKLQQEKYAVEKAKEDSLKHIERDKEILANKEQKNFNFNVSNPLKAGYDINLSIDNDVLSVGVANVLPSKYQLVNGYLISDEGDNCITLFYDYIGQVTDAYFIKNAHSESNSEKYRFSAKAIKKLNKIYHK